MDSTNLTCVVRVTDILQQLFYAIDSLNWVYNSSTPFSASVFITDTNPGAVNLTWNFGDGTIVSAMRSGIGSASVSNS